jgi:hypothetical protein
LTFSTCLSGFHHGGWLLDNGGVFACSSIVVWLVIVVVMLNVIVVVRLNVVVVVRLNVLNNKLNVGF